MRKQDDEKAREKNRSSSRSSLAFCSPIHNAMPLITMCRNVTKEKKSQRKRHFSPRTKRVKKERENTKRERYNRERNRENI